MQEFEGGPGGGEDFKAPDEISDIESERTESEPKIDPIDLARIYRGAGDFAAVRRSSGELEQTGKLQERRKKKMEALELY